MRARCREMDWAATPLGPVDSWPPALRTAAALVLASGFASALHIGREATLLYNDAWAALIGHNHPRAFGRSSLETFADLRGELEPRLRRVWSGETLYLTDAMLPAAKSGTPEDGDRWFTISYAPLRDDRGEVIAVHSITVETTGTRRALASAEAARTAADFERRQLETVLEHLPVGVTLAEAPSGRLLVSNRAVRRIWGLDTPAADVAAYSAHYVGYRPGTDHQYESHEWPLARALTRGEVVTDEIIEIERPDGTRRLVSISAAPVRDDAGQVLGGIVTSLDVTDRERARADADAAGTRARALLDSIGDAFYLLDRDWRFAHVNAAAEPLLRRTREQLVGRSVWEEFPEAVGSPFDVAFREALATGRVTFTEAFYPPLDSWFDVRVYPWVGGLMVYFRNVNERKAAEAERERLLADAEAARAEAEAANRSKSEFLAVMSHELRTPLNAIGGYAELLEMEVRGAVTPEQREDLRRIQMSQRHLLGLINEVLNYAKLETGTVQYAIGAVRLSEALGEAEKLVVPQARARGLTLTVAACSDALIVRADAEKLRQVMLNLLSNAVKFTDRGGRVDVECEAEGDVVRVRVRDTGIGIPADRQEAIFEPFVQVRSDLTRTAEGAGLGLAISRELARGMGGDLTVASVHGEGSTFTLTLPAAHT